MPQEPSAGPLHIAMCVQAAAHVCLRRTARLWWGFPEGIDLAGRRWAKGSHGTLMPRYQVERAMSRRRHVKRVIRALTGVERLSV
jgi:hypothetical protein